MDMKEESGVEMDKPSVPNSANSENMVSRMQTLLRQATLVRDSKPGTPAGGILLQTVQTLHREKTAVRRQSTASSKSAKHGQVGIRPTKGPEEEEKMDEAMAQFLAERHRKRAEDMTDSDFDTDLEEDFGSKKSGDIEEKPPRTSSYRKACRCLGVEAVPQVMACLDKGKAKGPRDLILQHRLFNALEVLAITTALVNCSRLTKLVLDGSRMGDAGALCVVWLMQDHGCYLQSLSLRESQVGGEGVEALGAMLEDNKSLRYLDLTGNFIDDFNVPNLANALKENRQLQYLNLSHNYIGDLGAKLLATALGNNDGLLNFDLSWNKIRSAGSEALCKAMKENITLKSLHLAMNGMGESGAMYVGDTLRENSTLTYLDVTYTRITDKGAAFIAGGLLKNDALHHLIIHNNPLTSKSAMILLQAIHKNTATAMWKLDMSTIPVVAEAVAVADEISKTLGEFEFRYSGLVNCDVPMLRNDGHKLNPKNPLSLVKEYIEHEGLRLLDFFKIMDKDHSGSISRDEFVVGLNTANVTLTQYQLDKLIETLDADGDGEIDYAELIEGDREWRRKQRARRCAEMDLISTLTKGRNDYFGYFSTT